MALRRSKKSPRDLRGGVMVETAICIPVLIIFFFGILEVGRALVQMSWVQRSAYNSTLLATYTPEVEMEAAVLARTRSLQNLTMHESCGDQYQNCGATIAPGLTGSATHYSEVYEGPETSQLTVRVAYDSATLPLGTLLSGIGVDTSVVGPYLLNGIVLTGTDQFGNPSGVFGDCGQIVCGSPPPIQAPPKSIPLNPWKLSRDATDSRGSRYDDLINIDTDTDDRYYTGPR